MYIISPVIQLNKNCWPKPQGRNKIDKMQKTLQTSVTIYVIKLQQRFLGGNLSETDVS